jgi:hypothetical protein
MLYMLMLYNDPALPMPERGIERHFAFARTARERGAYVFSEAIGGPDVATTVRLSGGEPVVTDGPFAETKEVLGGFYILDCADLDEALQYASELPQHAVEIRPILGVEGWDYGATGDRFRQPMGAGA